MPNSLPPNITTQQMQAVLMIARCGSFVAAAEELNVPQSSLSRIIQTLEANLKIDLFVRSTRRVELTTAGEEFIAVAERVLDDLGIVVARMRDSADQKHGQVILSTLMSIAQGVLPPIIAQYRSRHAGIDVHVREGVEQGIEQDLRSGISDFAIAAFDGKPEAFQTIPLMRERLRVVLPENHELAASDRISLKKLRGIDLISLPAGTRTRQILDGAAAAADMRLNHAMTARQFATIVSMIDQGLGVAILPENATRAFATPGVVSRPLTRPALHRDLFLGHLADRPLSPSAQGLFDLIQHTLATS